MYMCECMHIQYTKCMYVCVCVCVCDGVCINMIIIVIM